MAITYCYLEGTPAIYVEPGGGTYWYINDQWTKATGRDSADIATKSSVMSKADFDKTFPGLPAPPVGEDQGAPADTEDKFLPRRR